MSNVEDSPAVPQPPGGRSPGTGPGSRPPSTSALPDDDDGSETALVSHAESSALRTTLHALREVVQLLLVALILAFIIKTVALQAFFIPSGSMLETLQIGDRVLVEKISYRIRAPERGEVIVFRRPGLEQDGFSVSETWTSFLEGIGLSQPDPNRDLIKRIIGLPGETVEVTEGVVLINGTPLEPEPYAAPEPRSFPATVIPDGEYFVMGDNRTNSLDSRFELGTIPEGNIIGRSFAIIWPLADATVSIDTDYPVVGEDPVPPQQ